MPEVALPERVSLEKIPRPDLTCPCCEGRGLTIFYRVEGIPVHSCLLMPSRAAAMDYPRGQLSLAYCSRCSFITNAAFDAKVHEYSVRYEETQGFSPTFRRFADDLARRVVEDYRLDGKHALEVGCGKGEFLALLCERGMASGVGLDPSYRPERLNSPAKDRIRFIQDFYGEPYARLAADLICCRHTLEHIHHPAAFMRMIRRTAGDRRDSLIFFEIPDVVRELREGAFWDLYYEHCAYFSPASITACFEHTGFDVERVWLEFGDQYLMITAFPDGGPKRPRPEVRPTAAETVKLIEQSTSVFAGTMSTWLQEIRSTVGKGQRVALWGSGSKAVSFITTLGLRDEVSTVVDINPHRQGTFIAGSGHAIVGPDSLRTSPPDLVIVMNPVYVPEITAQLSGMGLHPRVVGLGSN